ncbi:NAD(P)H-hydrate epimerase [Salirhabdus euzebyi]|uniref:Bifunctional NAD(P)H-hydrate repair enzyme n=1 Tax=Salirhabdus euzebyi TaxID=394506 RepID=A0A841Q765_9BACI|nr:NAD(P)H-hydrate dehydratase [Salirhabdus euzebyi]MBB6454184.1 NAD(P)H-hydrate epimerase [Salirhabdus euzebyi]
MHIVTAKEMYEVDSHTVQSAGIDGKILMENAGRAVATNIEKRVANTCRILIFTGSGNNGGDGFVIARTLHLRGYHVEVVSLVDEEKINGDAKFHYDILKKLSVPFHFYKSENQLRGILVHTEAIVDCMLGIGVKGHLKSPYKEVVGQLNKLSIYKVAVDIPTGIPADEGVEVKDGLYANVTFSIQYPKITAFLERYASYYGEWVPLDIGLIPPIKPSFVQTWGRNNVQATLPKRKRFAHKGTFGKGLVIGGSDEMPGSVMMTARAALRSGAGLITIGTTRQNIPAIASYVPEATYKTVDEMDFLSDQYTSVAVGMGLGRTEKAFSLIEQVIRQVKSLLLLDADALYYLKQNLSLLKEREYPTVLTPHAGEMARLLGITTERLLLKPFTYSKAFAKEYNVHLVLKGPFTIITNPQGEQFVITNGNVGLAKGGSGDVLAGILLSFMMQGACLITSLCNGCWIHGASADHLIENGRYSKYDLLATDLMEGIGSVFHTFS